MDIEANKLGGDFIAPDASREAKKAILAIRTLMYAGEEGQEGEIIKRAISGSDSLVDGSIPMIAMVVSSAEQKLGQLSPQDLEVVVTHIAGTIVEIARDLGDPEAMAEDGRTATDEITDGVMEVLTAQEEPDPAMMQGMDPMAPEMPPQGPAPMPLMRSAQ